VQKAEEADGEMWETQDDHVVDATKAVSEAEWEDDTPTERMGVSVVDLFDMNEEQEWQDRALCAQTDPEAFFPEKGGSTREAKRICQVCEVRSECLEYALGNDERFGIWGGLSERERRKLKKRAV
jgi:WhiB family redox-sensing transcriptional regulator